MSIPSTSRSKVRLSLSMHLWYFRMKISRHFVFGIALLSICLVFIWLNNSETLLLRDHPNRRLTAIGSVLSVNKSLLKTTFESSDAALRKPRRGSIFCFVLTAEKYYATRVGFSFPISLPDPCGKFHLVEAL